MPSNTYYSVDEYYTDDNSVDEQLSQNSDHSSIYETQRSRHKCNRCQERREHHQQKRGCRDDHRPDKCNKCGKYRRQCEEKERKCKCEKHCNNKCHKHSHNKCKTEDNKCKPEDNKCKSQDNKCIVIKIRGCR
jgi:hypothetical protein